jgi:hypothetical protein
MTRPDTLIIAGNTLDEPSVVADGELPRLACAVEAGFGAALPPPPQAVNSAVLAKTHGKACGLSLFVKIIMVSFRMWVC